MKIEIDLNDLLQDEYGNTAETLAESIRRQVIEEITSSTKTALQTQIRVRVQATIDSTLTTELAQTIPTMVDEVLNGTYIPVDEYGRKGTPTTFRTQIIDVLQKQIVYKPARYDSDKNAFTRAVDAVVEEQMKSFRAAFRSQVTDQFTKDALNFAVTEMRKRLGLEEKA